MLTKAELIADGCVPNPHMWIGDGWMYCPRCQRYAFHQAWSRPGDYACYEVCPHCDTYNGQNSLRGTNAAVVAGIVETAKDFTRRYAAHLLSRQPLEDDGGPGDEGDPRDLGDTAVKCDGNHAGPACDDAECWHRD